MGKWLPTRWTRSGIWGWPAPPSSISQAGKASPKTADILLRLLHGKDRGPHRDIVCLNAAGVLMVAGVEENLEDGIERASALIDSGAALTSLERLKEFTNE